MIKFTNVSFSYRKEASTVQYLNFTIEKGEFVALIGENGAGKSTTARLMNGLLIPETGKVEIMGMDTKSAKTSQLARHIGFLFQNPDRQLCRNTVREELKFGLELTCREKKTKIEDKAEQILEIFELNGDNDPFLLSRGERQRVALASLVAVEPEILILDEPTTGLDGRECSQIMEVILQLNQNKKTTVVMICHDMELVFEYAKRAIVLAGGRVQADGMPAKIFRDKEIMERASLIPPQLTELAIRLGGMFYHADRMDDFMHIINMENGGK